MCGWSKIFCWCAKIHVACHRKYQNKGDADPPALWSRTVGLNAASISPCCRRTSSSYSAIVLSTSSKISSAAAKSRCFTKALSFWTLDMFADAQQQLFLHKLRRKHVGRLTGSDVQITRRAAKNRLPYKKVDLATEHFLNPSSQLDAQMQRLVKILKVINNTWIRCNDVYLWACFRVSLRLFTFRKRR